MPKKFLRRQGNLLSKLGKGRKKKQKWRRPTGRDNKMREKRKGYLKVVSISYKKSKIDKKDLKIVKNVSDLEKIVKGKSVIVGKVGKKKRIEIVEKAKEKGIIVSNINAKKFLKKVERKKKVKKETEKKVKQKKIAREKK
ncbi:50S ribosomal protein L32e [Candidatus Pacearchaeota archaeon]|nr:50S ribosomal protein L32e [Candidatus Pacearchaeota archaeon]|tara:strand:- start:164 stop:583 length:420 start_codon:yes stop_codon:yes gene_type:complete